MSTARTVTVILTVIVSCILAAALAYTVLCLVRTIKRRKQEKAEGVSVEIAPKEWALRHRPTRRRLIQVYTALLYNVNIKGFLNGNIYQGDTKLLCVPGLNCYSCPGAVAACPLGALQNALASSDKKAPYYVVGIILLFGILLGRTICGFLCPVGLGQELLYKIKTPKLPKSRVTRVLSYLKYVILVIFVISLPLAFASSGVSVPAFCKYLCPGGTLGGAIWLLVHPANADMFAMLGWLFLVKFCGLMIIVVACVFIYRGFCRFLCPLGALYGLFNRLAPAGVKLQKDSCTECGACINKCKMDVKRVGDHECINCGECAGCCPTNAIKCQGFWYEKNEASAEETDAVAEVRREIDAVAPQKDKKFGKRIIAWSAALAVLLGAFVYYNFLDTQYIPAGQSVYEVGDICPDISLGLYGGGEFVMSETDTKVVIINYWATWCGPCVAELPEFERIAEQYGQDVSIVAVHSAMITENGGQDGVLAYINGKTDVYDSSRTWADYSVKFAQDSGEGLGGNVYTMLGGKSLYPMTVILDGSRKIAFVRQGSVTFEILKEQIDAIL